MIVDGWLDWAQRVPGIADKVYSEKNRGLGLIGHSIVGTPEAALGRFLSTQRGADGRYTPYAEASVMFINPKVGPLIQMYPVWASTWTSGGREANTSLWAIESEGGALDNVSEPLNDNQVANLVRLAQEFEAYTGRRVVRSSGEGLHEGDTFREHGEVARQYGYASTACPSRRYGRFYEALAEEDAMEPARLKLLRAADGPFGKLDETYTFLRSHEAGFFAEWIAGDNEPGPFDGRDDGWDAMARRECVRWVAWGPRAQEAVTALGW